jgi:hypothetical protein
MEYKTHTHTLRFSYWCAYLSLELLLRVGSQKSKQQQSVTKANRITCCLRLASLHFFTCSCSTHNSHVPFSTLHECVCVCCPFSFSFFLDEYTVERQAPFGGRVG